MQRHWHLAGLTMLVLSTLAWADDPPQAKEKDKDIGKSYSVPFRLTDSGHIMVRAKINGKGPFNFIVDTGAPLVYVSLPAAKKAGITPEKKGQNKVAKFEIEGGPAHTDLKCQVETPFQLEGMNATGIAGIELHGMIGYTLLSHYKMEIDLTKDRMTWTKLDFTPPAPQPFGGKGADLSMIGKLLKFLAMMSDNKGPQPPELRGFIGVELGSKGKGVVLEAVLAKSPAAAAGILAGDQLLAVQGKAVASPAEVSHALAKVRPAQTVVFRVMRAGETREITITAGEGL